MAKVGDLVREIETGDEGIIVRVKDEDWDSKPASWWIKWATGSNKGDELWLNEGSFEVISGASDIDPAKDEKAAIELLKARGYTITKTF